MIKYNINLFNKNKGVFKMSEQLEDRSFKRLTDTFPVPMLKYLHVNHDRTKPYKTTLEITKNNKQFLDYVLEISENKVIDLEFHSTVLTLDHLGRYGTYKIYLRIDSKKLVYQCILCTADPISSKRQLYINENEKLEFDIVFTQEDDADEKIKILEDIINNNRTLTNTDIEIIYLTVALFMKSELSKSELLLKISELTNQVQGLSNEELYEIKLFQKAFMKKFISDDDKLKEEIEKMISLTDMEAMKEIFPKESLKIKKEGIEIGIEKGIEKGKLEEKIKTAENMKREKLNTLTIAKITGLSLKEIEKL